MVRRDRAHRFAPAIVGRFWSFQLYSNGLVIVYQVFFCFFDRVPFLKDMRFRNSSFQKSNSSVHQYVPGAIKIVDLSPSCFITSFSFDFTFKLRFFYSWKSMFDQIFFYSLRSVSEDCFVLKCSISTQECSLQLVWSITGENSHR